MPSILRNAVASTRASLALLLSCAPFLARDPLLVLLALINGLLAAVFMIPLSATRSVEAASGGVSAPAAAIVLGLLGCRLASTVINGAIIRRTLDRMTTGAPSRQHTLLAVARHLPVLLAFSVVALGVDFVAFVIRKHDAPGWLGPLADVYGDIRGWLATSIDTAWQVATFVALPSIMAEDRNVIGALRRSRELIRVTWGPGVAAVVGLRAAAIVLCGLGVLVLAVIAAAVPDLKSALTQFAFVWFVTVVTVLSAIGQVYRAAVYLYATGQAPIEFPSDRLVAAFA